MRALLVIGLALLLGACAGQPTRTAPPLSPQEQAAHARAYAAERVDLREAWSLSGRIAVSANGRGGSGRIDWSQTGDRFDIALSAPVTRQSWRLSGHRGEALLEGLEGGPREGVDAGALLHEATGWTIPVDCLSDWVLGLACATSPSPDTSWDAQGRPLSIRQGGWLIQYQDWLEPEEGRPALPRRIFARADQGQASVRLVIDEWHSLAAVAAAERAANWAAGVWSDREGALLDPIAALKVELGMLDLRHPEADMRRNVAAGDERPLTVCGYSCETPGLPADFRGSQGVRTLDPTGDVLLSGSHMRLKEQAGRYAARYNAALARWLAMPQAQRRQTRPPVADAGPPPEF